MSKTGPILLIEDDIEDKEMLEEVLRDLNVKNPIVWLENTQQAYDYLCAVNESMFIIFCDIVKKYNNSFVTGKRDKKLFQQNVHGVCGCFFSCDQHSRLRYAFTGYPS